MCVYLHLCKQYSFSHSLVFIILNWKLSHYIFFSQRSVLQARCQQEVDAVHVQQRQSQNIYVPLIDVCLNL